MNSGYDAIVVGARCAGATLATRLARAGWRVLLVDRDRFPSDTVSTHLMFPDTLRQLDELGALDRLRSAHDIALLRFSWRVLGHQVAGTFTPIGGYDRAACVRRIVLDAALVATAEAAGADPRFGRTVDGLIGSGTTDDPVRGVVLDTGERISARWVFGADGRRSAIARRLGLRAMHHQRGELAFLLSYWRGLPASDWCHVDVHAHAALMSAPCEDGVHLLSLAGPPDITRGTTTRRERRYRDGLRQFPAVLNPRLLDRAERVSPLVVVPETMLRGFYRRASGPGWALVGDAGHFKHPATAQGISDAVHQARWIAETVTDGEDLSAYEAWRDGRAEEHYDWSFTLARFGTDRAAALYSGLADDPAAGKEFLDVFTKRRRPSQVATPERVARWNAAWAYADGLRAVLTLAANLDPDQLAMVVPACPDWTVRDLLAHLAGVAEDASVGQYFPGAVDAWRDPDLATARERWTAGHVAERAGWDGEKLRRALEDHGQRLVALLRSGTGFAGPAWMRTAPVADLAVHLHDLGEALGAGPDADSAVTRLGFAVYRDWLHARILALGLPALRLSDGTREWVLGHGEPAVDLSADRRSLFRAIAGRLSAAEIRSYVSAGDPTSYLPIIGPYPLPPDRADTASTESLRAPIPRTT